MATVTYGRAALNVPAASMRWPRSGTFRTVALELVAALAAVSREMSFVEHLEELRRRLIWSIGCVAVAFGCCWIFAGDLYDIASAPIRMNPAVTLSVSRPQDIFSLYFKVTLVASIFLSSPFVIGQAWMFISPGLYPHERRYAIPFVLSASFLFAAGGAFGYYVAFPAALGFLLDWIVASHLVPIIDAGEYFNLFFTIMVALGIVFQIPAVIFVLSRIGLVDARFLLRHLKYAVLGCLMIAAVITPTGDPGNMLIIAAPMLLLYCVGIVIAWVFGRHRRTEVPGMEPV
jgi:sec-independent protein translocase protein TatC